MSTEREDRLDQAVIQSACTLAPEQLRLILFDELPSTNDYLKKQAEVLLRSHQTIACLADSQTQGRGQFNRQWHSPPRQNIYLSLLYPFQKEVTHLSGLSLLVGLVLSEILSAEYLAQRVYVKWPNDAMCWVKDVPHKIAGVLVEIIPTAHHPCAAVLGIGLNVNMMQVDSAAALSQPWTSIKLITGQHVDRNILAARLLNRLWYALKIFAAEGLAPFQAAWAAHDILRHQPVSLRCANQVVFGLARGINAQGHLIVALATGEQMAFASGEASIIQSEAYGPPL
jgi:BirA family biotin operon repressor/biotin-[acetyl-CoA-carboxylase] ligase